jgi:hypothetical protein
MCDRMRPPQCHLVYWNREVANWGWPKFGSVLDVAMFESYLRLARPDTDFRSCLKVIRHQGVSSDSLADTQS